ncbi:hypothetical protein M404DRAFT_32971 [Pisolithus tinctorius Marx 270]|uniref:Nuclear pore complex protein n=1 Tax=Pisolithus tinctorius Marx 270 TaxID=870435 RepID=A0A0C3NM72_PISTI|nr:hypothetical protein M404DRAFT_32971 [Pisolithus tinctorius Marx 270]
MADVGDGTAKEAEKDIPDWRLENSDFHVSYINTSRKTLGADDAAIEKLLAQAIYSFIRAGRLDDAIELCRRAHQPWRAASIRGSLLFQWRAIANEQYLSDPERVVYAALTPTPQTSTVLRSACRTWEDHLWVQISILCEEKQSSEMLKLKRCFWEGALAALEEMSAPLNGADEEEEEEWQKEVISALETLDGVVVEGGPPADNASHVSQLTIIFNRIQPLLDTFAAGLRDGIYDPESSEYPTMARFFAHLCLCLFLQMVEIHHRWRFKLFWRHISKLIAMYAGALGDNAVERYAMFLTSLDLSADIKERRLALTRAREHGLDVKTVAIATAERTVEKAFEHLPPLRGPLPSIVVLQPEPSNVEMLLLRSIDWTSFMEATNDTALEQVTVILRFFLGTRRVNLARKLLDTLPPEIAAISEPEHRATGYLHYRQFFNIWEFLDRVTEYRSLEVSLMNKDTRAEWLRDYKLGRCLSLLLRDRNRCVTLELANIVADSRNKLYDDFLQPDGRRLGEYLSVLGHEYAKMAGRISSPGRRFTQATELYTQAIQVSPKPEPVFHGNRAACYLNMSPPQFELVVEDCDAALRHDLNYIKALNRRANALEALSRYAEALRDFTAATVLDEFQNEAAAQSVERVLKKLVTEKAQTIAATRDPRLPSQTFISAYFAAFRKRAQPTPPETSSQGDQTLLLALDALEAADYAHALSLVNEAVDQGVSWDIGRAEALNLRGTFKFLTSDIKGTKADLEESLALNPSLTQSPHFTIYQPQLTWLSSIANRATCGVPSACESAYIYRKGFSLAYLFAPGTFDNTHIVELIAELPEHVKYAGKFVLTAPFTLHS